MTHVPEGRRGPWTPADRLSWLARQTRQRSYSTIVASIDALRDRFDVQQYGTLNHPGGPFPLFGLRTKNPSASLSTALITGGVHGYETSGVLGALRFAEEAASRFEGRMNLAIAPCVSPWAYEVVHRWTPDAIDPNRSFVADSPVVECSALMAWVESLGDLAVHVDLHETTNSDNTQFRPEKAARDGVSQAVWNIPDGFYLVGRTDRPAPAFQAAVRDAVAEVTHIAEADPDGKLIGVELQQHGVIEYDAVALGLCMGMTNAPFTTTTEVYPDSPRASGEICIQAQVASVTGALEHVLRVRADR